MMAAAALTLFVVMMLLAGALRTLIQRHRTGDSGNARGAGCGAGTDRVARTRRAYGV